MKDAKRASCSSTFMTAAFIVTSIVIVGLLVTVLTLVISVWKQRHGNCRVLNKGGVNGTTATAVAERRLLSLPAPPSLAPIKALTYTRTYISTSSQATTGVALWYPTPNPSAKTASGSLPRPVLMFSAGRHDPTGAPYAAYPVGGNAFTTAYLKGIPLGAYSSVDVHENQLLLGGDSNSAGWQPSYVFQLPSEPPAFPIYSALEKIWQQPILREARGCTFGKNGSVILACIYQSIEIFSGPSLQTRTVYQPPGAGAAVTMVSVSCNKATGSVACGGRVDWSLIQAQPAPAACTTTDGSPFAKSAYLQGQATSLIEFETNMQAEGIFIGSVVSAEDIVVVGSSDNTTDSSARSFPLLFINGDPAKVQRLTSMPIAGRSVAVADISGNGLPDIFIVGTEGFHYLLLQGPVGVFTQQPIPTVPGDFYGRGVAAGRIFGSPDTFEVVISSLDNSDSFKNSVYSFSQI